MQLATRVGLAVATAELRSTSMLSTSASLSIEHPYVDALDGIVTHANTGCSILRRALEYGLLDCTRCEGSCPNRPGRADICMRRLTTSILLETLSKVSMP